MQDLGRMGSTSEHQLDVHELMKNPNLKSKRKNERFSKFSREKTNFYRKMTNVEQNFDSAQCYSVVLFEPLKDRRLLVRYFSMLIFYPRTFDHRRISPNVERRRFSGNLIRLGKGRKSFPTPFPPKRPLGKLVHRASLP